MNIKSLRTSMIVALFLVSLGGFLLHLRIHHLDNPANFIPFLCGLISMTVVIVMFMYKKTAAYAYLINGIIVVLGTITMAHFSYVHFTAPFFIGKIFLNTLFADIAILIGKFFLSKAIYESYFIKEPEVI
ncbi:MAG: hypothetical protein A2452_12770 [Candidatus Firestonebacteria bacterium RIFOXYC2_FULL_39_67]|nr:MAG: hypothetical protein A2536_12135 [Candidatus Firestonebacteria bacterium RIFOXYD2_FULL_39_29]OGF52817.1 MAG: hypothetical protein A2497_00935 [Candidatus Firestonebacteria bacterium RifOxyC12_full_39_7]OGF57436.1 MAG: hypothetical protein A2452_12770 [Candidatus Firestonebacteria bacterium RIFOXYC2_FULL_39_67]